jgi:hypothetical protein
MEAKRATDIAGLAGRIDRGEYEVDPALVADAIATKIQLIRTARAGLERGPWSVPERGTRRQSGRFRLPGHVSNQA